MKKQTYCALSMLLLMGLVSSCKGEGEEVEKNEEQIIKLYVEGIETRTSTGELNQTYITPDNTVGAFGVPLEGEGTVTNGKNNKYIATEGGNLIADSGKMTVSDETTSVNIYAYAPYNESWTQYDQEYEFNIQTDQSTEEGYLASDLLSSTGSTYEEGQDVGLTFKHKLSKVNLEIIREESALDISSSKITLNNTKIKTKFNPSTGYISEADGAVKDITMLSQIGAESEKPKAYCIIVPQTINGGSEIFTIGEGEKAYSVKFNSDFIFKSGYSYNFTITVKANGIELKVGKNTVEDWEDGDGDNEEDENYPDYSLTENEIFSTKPDTGFKNIEWEYNNNKLYWWAQPPGAYLRIQSSNLKFTEWRNYKTMVLVITDFKKSDYASSAYLLVGSSDSEFFVLSQKEDIKKEDVKIDGNGTFIIDFKQENNARLLEGASTIGIFTRATYEDPAYFYEKNSAVLNNIYLTTKLADKIEVY